MGGVCGTSMDAKPKKTLAHSMILSNLLNFGSVDNFATPNSFYVGGIANVSFGSLFVSMFFFWVNGSRFLHGGLQRAPTPATPFFSFARLPLGPSRAVLTKQNITYHLGNFGMFFSNIALFLLLLLR